MATPNLSTADIAWIVESVADYIRQQREKFRPLAMPLTGRESVEMQPFFAASTLDSVRTYIPAQRIANPPFYPTLIQMGFAQELLPDFSQMDGITFIDTVVAHVPFTDTLLFHELVHVVQYDKLGLQTFSAKYVQGFLTGGSYEAIPLEKIAYQLQEEFEASPFFEPFSVADEVQKWIDQNKF